MGVQSYAVIEVAVAHCRSETGLAVFGSAPSNNFIIWCYVRVEGGQVIYMSHGYAWQVGSSRICGLPTCNTISGLGLLRRCQAMISLSHWAVHTCCLVVPGCRARRGIAVGLDLAVLPLTTTSVVGWSQ